MAAWPPPTTVPRSAPAAELGSGDAVFRKRQTKVAIHISCLTAVTMPVLGVSCRPPGAGAEIWIPWTEHKRSPEAETGLEVQPVLHVMFCSCE